MRKFLIVLMVVTMASFLFVGCFVTPPVNTAPVITPIPDATVTVGDTFTYAVVATDPDVEDVLTYSLTVAPEDMLIDADSGVITWTIVTEGTFGVIVRVTDEGGLTDFEGFTITVSAVEPEPNNPPEITTSAITSGKVGVTYNYDVNATDPEGDTLTYSLTEKPLGMSIVATTGIISWIPTDAGLFGVGVKVSDPDGLFDVQSFNITVAKADEEEPEPEPELVLIGIAVDPKTMDLIVGGTETIESVTATYEIRSYGVDIALTDCLILTSDEDIATVTSDGVVEAVGEGTADIVVSYEGKFDTLKVTVIAFELDYITVYPKTLTIIGANVECITSVTAYYNDGTTAPINILEDCDYESNYTSIATVAVVSDMVQVTGVSNGIATITVSYTEDDITKTDTVAVEVSGFPPPNGG